MKLNLGCSTDLRGGDWINVDISDPMSTIMEARGDGVSYVGLKEPRPLFQQADLSLPWSWADSSVDEIYAADIFEHVGDCDHFATECDRCDPGHARRHWSGRIHVMNEAWRVLKPGGILTMECPDAAKGAGHFQDPQHVSPWTPNALQYYTDGSPAHKRFAEAYGITARFQVHAVTERMYEEFAGPRNDGSPGYRVRCEVWKFTARMEACK